MNALEIAVLPTTIDTGPNGSRYHESLLRSYHILRKVEWMLEKGASAEVILDFTRTMTNAPGRDLERG